jgi:primosomal replication protein N
MAAGKIHQLGVARLSFMLLMPSLVRYSGHMAEMQKTRLAWFNLQIGRNGQAAGSLQNPASNNIIRIRTFLCSDAKVKHQAGGS